MTRVLALSPRMELHQLKSFVTVAELGNLTRAAERLFTSQPAVSAHIKALEDECGYPLFRRTPRGMEPTAPAQVLLERARGLLAACAEFSQQAAALRHDVAGTLRLGINNDAEFLRLPAVLDDLATRHPALHFDLSQAPSATVLDRLLRHEIDVGFHEGPADQPSLESIHLADIALCVVGPKAWEAELTSWAAAARRPWVFVSPACSYYRFMARLHLSGVEPRFRSDSGETAYDLARSGLALTIIPRAKVPSVVDPARLFVWDGFDEELPLHLSFLRTRAGDPAVRAVADAVRAAWQPAPVAASLAA